MSDSAEEEMMNQVEIEGLEEEALNRAVLKALGWKRASHYRWRLNDVMRVHPPDYVNNLNRVKELLIDIESRGLWFQMTMAPMGAGCFCIVRDLAMEDSLLLSASEIGTLVCRAWLVIVETGMWKPFVPLEEYMKVKIAAIDAYENRAPSQPPPSLRDGGGEEG